MIAISTQAAFLKYLDDEEIQVFAMDSIKEVIGDSSRTLDNIVAGLVRKGFLCRLERGKYCRSTFRDEYVIGTFLARDGVVAYWSALNLHGLTEQFPNSIFIQTTANKETTNVLGTTYQFIRITESKQTGITYHGYGNYRYPLTDVEKTLVDCFERPQYSGGYAELIRAFAKTRLDADKLMAYCTAVDNLAVIKRMGFLAELLHKDEWTTFIDFARRRVTGRTYNLFDPFGNAKGETVAQWKLRLNLSREDIIGLTQTIY
jgi:predicted transcriptional regulator of viral defense system